MSNWKQENDCNCFGIVKVQSNNCMGNNVQFIYAFQVACFFGDVKTIKIGLGFNYVSVTPFEMINFF